MATTKTDAIENDNRVEGFIPRGTANEDPNFYVSVNGLTALLPRGTKSMVLPEKSHYQFPLVLNKSHLLQYE